MKQIECPKCHEIINKVILTQWVEIYVLDLDKNEKVTFGRNYPRECSCYICRQDLTKEVKELGIDIGGNPQSREDFKKQNREEFKSQVYLKLRGLKEKMEDEGVQLNI